MNRNTIVAATALAALSLVASSEVLAEPMVVQPGKWSFTSTMQQPMGGTPKTTTNVECIRDGSMTPEKFLADLKGCSLSDTSSTASSMQWKMNCPAPAGTMTGSGSIQSTGATVTGSIKMVMDMGAQKFPVENAWTGKRLGDCE